MTPHKDTELVPARPSTRRVGAPRAKFRESGLVDGATDDRQPPEVRIVPEAP